MNPKSRTQPLLFIWKTRRGTEVRRLIKLKQVLRKLIKLRKFLMDDYSKKLGEMFGGMRNNA